MTEVRHSCEGAYIWEGRISKSSYQSWIPLRRSQVIVLGIELTNIGLWNIKFEVLHTESTFLVKINLKVDISAITAVEILIIEH